MDQLSSTTTTSLTTPAAAAVAATSPQVGGPEGSWPILQQTQAGLQGAAAVAGIRDADATERRHAYGIVPPTQTLLDRVRLKQLQVGGCRRHGQLVMSPLSCPSPWNGLG